MFFIDWLNIFLRTVIHLSFFMNLCLQVPEDSTLNFFICSCCRQFSCLFIRFPGSLPLEVIPYPRNSPSGNHPKRRFKVRPKDTLEVGWAFHRLIIMQWSNLTRCGLPCGPHTSSIGVATFCVPWYRSTHPDPRKSPQLQIWPHHWFDTFSQPSVFFSILGNRQQWDGAKSGEYRGWSTSSKPQSR